MTVYYSVRLKLIEILYGNVLLCYDYVYLRDVNSFKMV